MFCGDPGLGKTTLWQSTVDQVEQLDRAEAVEEVGRVKGIGGVGGLVASTRCSELETTLGYAGLADLVGPFEQRWRERLPEHLSSALAVATMLSPRTSAVVEPLAVLRGAQLALEVAAEGQPFLVIGIDDVQWLDPESAQAVSYALRRWTSTPVGLLVTWRAGTAEPVGLNALPGPMEVLEIGPLDNVSLTRLVADRAGHMASAARLDEVVQSSAGNPFYALALAQAPPGVAVPVGLEAMARGRLVKAGTVARGVIDVVAVRGPLPAATLIQAGLGSSLDAAVGSGVLVEIDGQVRFDHPLLSRVAYQQLPPGRRIRLHQEAAAVAASVEERATHLAHTTTGPDLEIAALLDEAAGVAFARYARDAAGALSQHAVRLTDPRDVESLGRRLADVAWSLTESQPDAASSAADQVLQLGLRGPDRARALQVKNETSPTWQESLRWLAEARAEPGLDPILSVNLRAEHAWISGCLRGGNLDEACQEARAAVEDAAGMSPSVRIGVMAVWCWLSSLRGDLETMSRFEEALALDGPDVQPTNRFFVRIPFAGHLAAQGRWADAIAQLDAQVAAANRHGDDVALGMAYASRARLELTRGDADALDRHLALLGTAAARDPMSRTELSVVAALARARRGDPAAPEAAAAAADISLEDLAFGPGWVARTVDALIKVTNGQPELAADEFATWVDLVADGPIPRPELVTLYPEAITALVSAGRGDTAAVLLDALNRPGRPDPLATVIDNYGRALIALGQGDTTAALTHLHTAQTDATAIDARWLNAIAAYAQGQTLHRAGRRSEAAEAFTTSAAHFNSMHATTWGERARRHAHAAVPRPRQENTLTPSETKVVDAAASGMSNAEIAAALFITVATVEAHLTRAYRKLGIRSRAGLAVRLMDRNS